MTQHSDAESATKRGTGERRTQEKNYLKSKRNTKKRQKKKQINSNDLVEKEREREGESEREGGKIDFSIQVFIIIIFRASLWVSVALCGQSPLQLLLQLNPHSLLSPLPSLNGAWLS